MSVLYVEIRIKPLKVFLSIESIYLYLLILSNILLVGILRPLYQDDHSQAQLLDHSVCVYGREGVCVCVCLYVSVRIFCVWVSLHLWEDVCVRVCVRMCFSVCVCDLMCVWLYVYLSMRVQHLCVHVCVYTYVCHCVCVCVRERERERDGMSDDLDTEVEKMQSCQFVNIWWKKEWESNAYYFHQIKDWIQTFNKVRWHIEVQSNSEV